MNKCKEQFWCKPHSNIEVLMENSSLPMRTSCASGCSPKWKTFDLNSNILDDKVRAGSFSPGISSFIGRTLVNGELQIGRIQISHPAGLYYSLDGSVRFTNSSIDYLENSNFIWKNSSHGALVKEAVTVQATRNLPFYIGRHQVDGLSYVGTVVRVLGLMYYGDENGIERTTDCYEVLTCQNVNDSDLDARPSGSAENAEFNNSEYTESIENESTASSIATTTESAQNSVHRPIIYPSDHSGLSGINTTIILSSFLENSSQNPHIENQTIIQDINNSNGYSYHPPSLPFSSSTSNEHSQDNFSTIASITSQTISTESSNILTEAATASAFSKPPTTALTFMQSNSTVSSYTSQTASPTNITKPPETALISMHSWTQAPPLSYNEILSTTLVPQMSSISSSTATTTNAEVNENEESLSENASGIGGDFGMNTDEESTLSPIDSGNEENLHQITGNLVQSVVENEGDVEELDIGSNYSQATSTEGIVDRFELNNTHAIENVAGNSVIQIIQHPEAQNTENPSIMSISITNPTIAQTTTVKSTRRTTTKASNSSLTSTEMNFIFTSTEANDLTSENNTTMTPKFNESASPVLISLGSSGSSESVTSSYSVHTTDIVDIPGHVHLTDTQITMMPAIPQAHTTATTKSPQVFTTSTSKVTETMSETLKPDLVNQNTSTTASVSIASPTTPSNLQESNLSSIFLTSEDHKEASIPTTTTKVEESTQTISSRPTPSKYTTRSTTSRTTRTKLTRRTTTKRTPIEIAIELQNEGNSKPGWLFTTSGTTESVNKNQMSVDSTDTGGDTSTEEFVVNEDKEMFECVPHWKQLPAKPSFLFDGIEITSQNANFLSHIGKINISNSYILGKIDINPQNLPAFSFSFNNSNQVSTTNTISYLSKTQLQNFSWKISSKGLAVKNAISINQTGNWPYYIGRIKSNGVILIGKVLPSIGLVYADKYGNEKITKAYEVLTCETVVDEVLGCEVKN
ncbi:unnamed protein product [Chironomus riparius]|uniref:Uncharacterized protein n=1 Tax=Chironomus riparius TaxID=315576 RepID=A0A9N9WYW2_9DIPT|nr:unnamed protein product [Chironomus riparius]